MTVEKEDLGLSLSLHNFPVADETNRFCNSSLIQLNSTPPRFDLLRRTSNWTDSFHSSSDRDDGSAIRVDMKSFVKGIDMNRIPVMELEAEEEEAGVSSPNSTVSSISGKRSERDQDHDGERTSPRGISDEDDGDNSRKKLRLSKGQSAVLEESFKQNNTLNPKQKEALAKRLGLRSRQVEVWFQNRRARTKLKQTEVECELMKKCCENLREENMRLQKELQELRALKVSPQFYMQRTPPTTLTMCPSCEHVSAPPPQPPLLLPPSSTAMKPQFNTWVGSHA